MRIYLAAALFTEAERKFNRSVAFKLRKAGHNVYLPQNYKPRGRHRSQKLFRRNLRELGDRDAVVAVCEGQQIDDGTAWEIGHARALGKTVYGLRTDKRSVQAGERINLMIQESLKGRRLHNDVPRLVRAVSSAARRVRRR